MAFIAINIVVVSCLPGLVPNNMIPNNMIPNNMLVKSPELMYI
jgi:hypothetical protein